MAAEGITVRQGLRLSYLTPKNTSGREAGSHRTVWNEPLKVTPLKVTERASI